jgi:hypothetical protein
MFYETNLALIMGLNQGRKCGKRITGKSTVKAINPCVVMLIRIEKAVILLITVNSKV